MIHGKSRHQMAFVYTWTHPKKQIEISCVSSDIDKARVKAIEVIQELDDISKGISSLNEKRKELIKELQTAPENEKALSACSPLSKDIIRKYIVETMHQCEQLRNGANANLSLGTTSLTDITYVPDKTDELSLIHLVIRTDPVITEFKPVTIKRSF